MLGQASNWQENGHSGASNVFPKGMGLTKMQLLMLALMLGASNLALADEPSFAKLQAMCRDRKDQADQGFCLGFVQAIALHVARENKDCTILQKYIDSPNADRVFPDLIADLDPQDYSGGALKSVEKFLLNRGCS